MKQKKYYLKGDVAVKRLWTAALMTVPSPNTKEENLS